MVALLVNAFVYLTVVPTHKRVSSSVNMPQFPTAFAGVWAKLNWAHEYLQELDGRAFFITRANSDFIGVKEDAQTGQRIYRLLRDPIIPVGFPLLAGTILQSLRSGLDHLAYALCVAGPGGDPLARANDRQINFPITLGDRDAYKALESRRVVVSLSRAGVEEALDAVEPYKGGAGILLTHLNALNNADKHRLLLTVALNTPMRDHTNTTKFDPKKAAQMRLMREVFGGLGFWPAGGAPLKAGDEVFREPLDSKTDEKMNFTFAIALNEPEIMPMEPVVDLLHNMSNLVRNLVPKFDAFV